MNQELFEQTLRSFVRRQPFQTFVVELADGGRIVIGHPEALAFDGGIAGYIGPESEPAFFNNEQVVQISMARSETAS